MRENTYGKGKVLEGTVISDKMAKTVTVAVVTKAGHHLYKKQIIHRKKYKVHDEERKAKMGDRVRIVSCRPLSRDKRFRLLAVLNAHTNAQVKTQVKA